MLNAPLIVVNWSDNSVRAVSRAHHGCNVQTKIPVHIILGRRQDNILIILLDIGNPGSNISFLTWSYIRMIVPATIWLHCHLLFSDILLHQKTDRLRAVGGTRSRSHTASNDSSRLSSNENSENASKAYPTIF